MKFFRNSLVKGRLICNNSDEIKACFDENNALALEEVFEYCGFRKMKQLSNILIPQSTIMVNEHNPGHILTYVNAGQINVCNFINDKDQKIFWKELDEGNESPYKTFELLPNLNYIPLISKYEVFNLMAK